MSRGRLTFVLLVLLPALAFASSQNAVIYGTVYDAHGKPLPRVTVTLENTAIYFTRTTITGKDGSYSFPEVPPANGYRLAAFVDGKVLDERPGITCGVGDEVVIRPPLQEPSAAAQRARVPRPAATSPDASRPATTSAVSGTIVLTSEPPAAQVYLDDAFRGQTAQYSGRVVLGDVAPGPHTLRVSQAGFNDFTQSVNVAAGGRYQFQATLERAGPRPLSFADIEELLTGSVANIRVSTIVRECGVDFALTDQQEAQLRKIGADDKLIIAILKNKK